MTDLTHLTLSVSKKLFNTTIDQHITLETIIGHIAGNNTLKSKIKSIQLEADSHRQSDLKKRLPLFYPALWLEHYRSMDSNNAVHSTGLVHFDVDEYNAQHSERLMQQLINKIPYLVYAFRSPRKGLKFALASDFISTDKKSLRINYTCVYNALKDLLNRQLPSIKLDQACKQISQSCFFSYDPNLYVNYHPQVFSSKKVLQNSRQKSLNYKHTQRVNFQTVNQTRDNGQVLKALTYIPANLDYYTRFRINMAIISVFGNEAETILLNHWQHENPIKLHKDIRDQIKYTMTHHIRITIGTLYYYAKQYGFKFYSA